MSSRIWLGLWERLHPRGSQKGRLGHLNDLEIDFLYREFGIRRDQVLFLMVILYKGLQEDSKKF